MENSDLMKKVDKAYAARDEFKKRFEQLKGDMVSLKRKIDEDKEA
jgi:peptidoglycan hydrolase CwlO-like protein